jgi:hypothetical protein
MEMFTEKDRKEKYRIKEIEDRTGLPYSAYVRAEEIARERSDNEALLYLLEKQNLGGFEIQIMGPQFHHCL